MGHNPGRLSEKLPVLAYTKKQPSGAMAGGLFSMPGKEG